ncbi:MAG: hypothetical protein ACLQU1_37385 [Bryobacteraceae bacterium]
MLRGWKIAFVAMVIVALCATGVIIGTISAQNPGISPHPLDKMALAEDEVKQLLLLMDTDKNGRISRQEFMSFMEAEFDRLDKDKNGELDVKELAQSRFRVSHLAVVGK